MKNYFKYDFINKAIVGSKAAIKRANSGNGNEYLELCKMLAEHPDFRVVPKEIEVNATKKKYNGLTFNRMKEYIELQEDSENVLAVFEKVQEIAEASKMLSNNISQQAESVEQADQGIIRISEVVQSNSATAET